MMGFGLEIRNWHGGLGVDIRMIGIAIRRLKLKIKDLDCEVEIGI